MPRWLTNALRAQLETQKVPWKLVDGPEPLDQRQSTEPHIVLQRDEALGDPVGPPRGLGEVDKRNLHLRTISMELLVFARTTGRSGQPIDHEDQADVVVKQLLVALYHVFQAYEGPRWIPGTGRFLRKEELEERRLQQWTGRIYRQPFGYDDTVKDENYQGAGDDTIAGGDFDVETQTETEGQGGTQLPSASTELP